jgi:hypothetical protein
MNDILKKLQDKIVSYNKHQYLFISDICEITGIQKTYIYLLKKKKTLKFIEKDSVSLIEYDSFIQYFEKRTGKENSINKTELMKQIKNLSNDKLEEIKKLLDGNI